MSIDIKTLAPYKVIDVSGLSGSSDDTIEIGNKIIQLINTGDRHIAINLSQTGYMHSSFIKTIMFAYKELKALGGDLVIVGPNELMVKVLDSLNISSLVQIYPNEKSFTEAINASNSNPL